jgi:hypothetical protein
VVVDLSKLVRCQACYPFGRDLRLLGHGPRETTKQSAGREPARRKKMAAARESVKANDALVRGEFAG